MPTFQPPVMTAPCLFFGAGATSYWKFPNWAFSGMT